MREVITDEPFADRSLPWHSRGSWPASWIEDVTATKDEPAVYAFRRRFHLDAAARLRIHVSADERYELFIDGERVGRGPERGDVENWCYETHILDLAAGDHVLAARCWWLGPDGPAPIAQFTVQPGFLLAAEGVPDDLLNTGVARWESKRLGGYAWVAPEMCWGPGAKVRVDGTDFDWGFESGEGDGWRPARAIERARDASISADGAARWQLRPAMLPAMLETPVRAGVARHVQVVDCAQTRELPVREIDNLPDEQAAWNGMLSGEAPLVVPANSLRRAIVDLGDYYCAYPELIVSGGKGAGARIWWAEGLYTTLETTGYDQADKGNRDEIEGKRFRGIGDTFETDGGQRRRFDTLWWEAGRYLEVVVWTGDEPLTVESLTLRETHYPYDWQARFEASDPRLAAIVPTALRAMEMCSHETYMDCPYYEQLMYVGDTRLEVLTTYAATRDDLLPKKAVYTFDISRRPSGLTQSRYPTRVMQYIPPFSLWWVMMVHDHAMWRGNVEFVRERMVGVRSVLDRYRTYVNADGLVAAPNGWNFMDWVPTWDSGNPPDGQHGISALNCWQTAMALRKAAELEDLCGEPELAARNRALAGRIVDGARAAFWDETRGLFADDLAHAHFSEHSQCLAILAGAVAGAQRERVVDGLLRAPDLARTTIYFTHYLFEALCAVGRTDKLIERLGLWFGLAGHGLKTTPEMPEPTRSDCHAWGAHPVFHLFASILGIRPASWGFETVRIEPQLASLSWAKGSMPHPKGFIRVDLRQVAEGPQGTVELPEGVTGHLVSGGRETLLKAGMNIIG